MDTRNMPHVVIIGAGFAGLWAVKTLFGKKVSATIIDRNNYHTFLPLLYQVGAAEIEPEEIAYPVRSLLRGKRNVRYLRSTVDEISYSGRFVVCNGVRIPFDYLIISSGSGTNYFGVPGAQSRAFPLKSLDDAMILRNHILSCFERAAWAEDTEYRRGLLTFAIVGGGPTGVEFSGALAELINGPLNKDFPSIHRDEVQVVLIETADRLLSPFTTKQSDYALRMLKKKNIRVMLSSAVKEITATGITLADGSVVRSETVVWTAGVNGAAPKGDIAPRTAGSNRFIVEPTLRMEGQETVFVAGDLAHVEKDGRPLPMVAPVAIQQGRHAARNALRHIRGKELLPFRYVDKGSMATIGRNAAVTRFGKLAITGYLAWLVWLFVHILYLIGFRNKVFVVLNWVWDYIFFEKGVRLILPRCCDSPASPSCLRRECGERHAVIRHTGKKRG